MSKPVATKAAVQSLISDIVDAAVAGTLVKLALSKPTPAAGDLKAVDVRPIMVKRELKLSLTYHHRTRDIVKNHAPGEAGPVLRGLLEKSFTTVRLQTTAADVHGVLQGKQWVLTRGAPTQTEAPSLSHDRAKQRPLSTQTAGDGAGTGKAYLQALGLTDAQGHVLKSAQDKFRQINKYVEIMDGLVKALPVRDLGAGPLRLVDMGSGKGYLTFALYDHLANTLKLPVTLVGVEYRAELVALCNEIARANGFGGLSFVQGSIADYDCAGVEGVIALHACDTATDDALGKAVQAGAALVVVAPCCHKQVRREMNAAAKVGGGGNGEHGLGFLLQYGTYAERLAEMVTDGLRAQLLEREGYATKVFEFISDAHTPKNVMIVGTRRRGGQPAAVRARIEAEIATAKAQFGVRELYLERLLAQP